MLQLKFRQQEPSALLRHYVWFYREMEGELLSDEKSPEFAIPDGSLHLIFNLADSAFGFINQGFVIGPHRAAIPAQFGRRIHMFGISFRPGGAHRFLKLPMSDLTDRIVSIEEVFPEWGRKVEGSVFGARSWERRISVIEETLASALRSPASRSEGTVMEAVRAIFKSDGLVRVEQLAASVHTSTRQLEKHFATYVGLQPKLLARMVRLHRAIRIIDFGSPVDWASAVAQLGYHDQAHLIRDFKALCGKTPTAYLTDPGSVSKLFLME